MSAYYRYPSNIALRAACERLGYDYRRAADILGRPEKAVSNWFLGVSRPSQESLVLLSAIERHPALREELEDRHPPRPKKPRGKPFPKGPKNASSEKIL